MNKKLILVSSNLIALQIFSVFPEYFFSISILYILVVVVLITYNTYGLMIQKALSECISLVLLMVGFLIINDDLLSLNFLNFNHSFLNDSFSFFTKLTICLFSCLYFLIISNSLKEQKLISFEYLLITMFAVLGLLILCSSNDLLIAYLGIELFSLAFYVLASFQKLSTYSIESGIKYFVTGAISSAFFLLGSSFIYCFTGSINFSDFNNLFECSSMYFFYESVSNC
jgi:NADH-quinone oxidoreductase subunit N